MRREANSDSAVLVLEVEEEQAESQVEKRERSSLGSQVAINPQPAGSHWGRREFQEAPGEVGLSAWFPVEC